MKTKNLVGLASALIFGAALFLGLAVAAILFLGGLRDKEAEASLATTSDNSSSPEFVALYDSANQQITRVNLSDGTSQIFGLGLPNSNVYVWQHAMSSDGRLLAFCTVEQLTNQPSPVRLIVRDILAGQNLLEQDYGALPGCNPSAFSPDNSRVAVGFVFNSPITGEMNFPDEPNWALRVFDVNTGAVVQEIGANSPDAPDFESMTDFWFEPNISPMPEVLAYGDSSLYFLAFPFVGRDGPPAAPAFRWDFADNRLSQIDNLGNNGATFLAETAEIAYPHLNDAFPAAQPMGPVALANEIRMTDATGTHTIYRDTENIIAGLRFVNGGRQLAVMLIPTFNPENPEEVPLNRSILLNRDGSVENINSASQSYAQVFARSNGLGIIRVEQGQNANGEYTNFHQLLNYANGELSIVWEYDAAMSANGQVWLEFMWASPQTIAPNLAPFVAID